MTEAPIRKVLIVGGGTAGWMAACALNQALRHTGTRVEVVESEDIGTVGVGEATVPTIRDFNRDIGIDEPTFLKATQGTFKLGIQFCDWRERGTDFFHGFGDYVVNTGPFSTLNHWLVCRDRDAQAAGRLENYHMAAVLAEHARFTAPGPDPRSPLHYFAYAYHFDAGLYARLLRDKAEREGVVRHEGRIQQVTLDPETGFIRHVTLADGRVIEADLFIDCSGFSALLARGALDGPWLDYSHWLPVDRAWAVRAESVGPLLPYTRATALEAGWAWRIPLRSRTGHGYVFSSAFTDEDTARQRLLQTLEGPAQAEPRLLRFKTGRLERFWDKNCVAIGLASGFVEPLESTSISLIQGGVTRLISLIPNQGFNQRLAREYNRVQALEFDRIRDFIIMHYALTQRDDTPFWRHMREMALPDTLLDKIETFRETATVPLINEETFVTASWQSLFIGLGLLPRRLDPLMSAQPAGEAMDALQMRRTAMARAAQTAPMHTDYIDRIIKGA